MIFKNDSGAPPQKERGSQKTGPKEQLMRVARSRALWRRGIFLGKKARSKGGAAEAGNFYILRKKQPQVKGRISENEGAD